MQPEETEMNTHVWLSCPCSVLVLMGVRHLSCCSSGFCPTHSSPFPKWAADLGPAFYTCPVLGPLLPWYRHLQEVAMQCECWWNQEKECMAQGWYFGTKASEPYMQWEEMGHWWVPPCLPQGLAGEWCHPEWLHRQQQPWTLTSMISTLLFLGTHQPFVHSPAFSCLPSPVACLIPAAAATLMLSLTPSAAISGTGAQWEGAHHPSPGQDLPVREMEARLTGLQEEVQWSDGVGKPLCGFLQHRAELQMENRKTFPLPCLSMQSPCWRFSWEMIFQPFHPAGILTPGMDWSSAWGGVRLLSASLLWVSQATALDGQHRPGGQNAELQYLLWYRYHRDLNWVSFSLITLWPCNIIASSSCSFLSLCDGGAVQAHEPAHQSSSTL